MKTESVIAELTRSFAEWYFARQLPSQAINTDALDYAANILFELTIDGKTSYYFEKLWWQSLSHHQRLRFGEELKDSTCEALEDDTPPITFDVPPRSKTKVVVFSVDGEAYTLDLRKRPNYKTLQELIGGHFEVLSSVKQDGNGCWSLYVDEDGFRKQLLLNPFFSCVGPVVLAYSE